MPVSRSLCDGSGKKKFGIEDFTLFCFATLSPLLLVDWDLKVEDESGGSSDSVVGLFGGFQYNFLVPLVFEKKRKWAGRG